jgi:hypothetical protein
LKEQGKKTTKDINVFQIVGRDQVEQRSVILSLRLKSLSKKAIHHELVAVRCCRRVRLVLECDGILLCREVMLDLNSEEDSSAIIAQR